jgi:CHRD domain-containing protein
MLKIVWRGLSAVLVVAVCMFGTQESFAVGALGGLTLTGDDEVPAVKTSATGGGSITVAADKSVKGSVTTSNIAATAAHIHIGAAGANGPVIIPLTKKGDNEWIVPDGTKLSDDQFKSYNAGNLYVNVHTAANPGGEIRAQIKP